MVASWHGRLPSAIWMMALIPGRAQEGMIMKDARKNDVAKAPAQRRNQVFRLLSERLRRLSAGRPQTPSEVLQRQSRDER